MHSDNTPNIEQLLEVTHDWVLRLEEPDVSEETRAQFAEWLKTSPKHRDLYDQAITLREAFHELSNDDVFDANLDRTLAERFIAFTDALASYWSDTKLRIAAGAAVSVAALALVALPQFIGTQSPSVLPEEPVTANFETKIGENGSFILADGTEMTLGAASKVRSVYTTDKRILELISGSVFVDVERDEARPFSVQSGDLTATALGTSFDVRRAHDIHRVSVAEGKVEVAFPFVFDGEASNMLSRKHLGKGQAIAATSTNGLSQLTNVDPENIGVWRQDELIYEGAGLDEVFADANRYSPLPIAIEAGSEKIGDLQLRGVFHGTDIDQLLKTATRIHDIEIDRQDRDRIIVRKKQQN
ncbi:MAG: FecR domain-containing protein [Pseudomonadota bacterium]